MCLIYGLIFLWLLCWHVYISSIFSFVVFLVICKCECFQVMRVSYAIDVYMQKSYWNWIPFSNNFLLNTWNLSFFVQLFIVGAENLFWCLFWKWLWLSELFPTLFPVMHGSWMLCASMSLNVWKVCCLIVYEKCVYVSFSLF